MTQEELRAVVEEVAHFLPAQAPIGAFVHHNTLHAFESKPFHEAVVLAHHTLGGQPYFDLPTFRQLYQTHRITDQDLEDVSTTWVPQDQPIFAGCTLRQLIRTTLLCDLDPVDDMYIYWQLTQKQLLDRLPYNTTVTQLSWDDWVAQGKEYLLGLMQNGDASEFLSRISALESLSELSEYWGIAFAPSGGSQLLEQQTHGCLLRYLWGECVRLLQNAQSSVALASSRLMRKRTQRFSWDMYDKFHPVLIRLSASFLDTGIAYWPMPNREQGFYQATRSLFLHTFRNMGDWQREACESFRIQQQQAWTAEATVLHALAELGLHTPEEIHDFFMQECLALPGWAGMFHRLECHSQDRLRSFPYRLMDYLAVRLTLLCSVVPTMPYTSEEQLPSAISDEVKQTYRLFQFLLHAQVPFETIASLQSRDVASLFAYLETYGDFQRRAIFQEAYERHYRAEMLDAIGANAQLQRKEPPCHPDVQIVCCIDDREESFRRHLEEYSALNIETIGVLGFFYLPIQYQSLTWAHPISLCPIVVQPKYYIREVAEDHEVGKRWKQWWLWLHRWGLAGYIGTKNMFRGFLFSIAGIIDAFPMLLWLLWPALGHRVRTFFYQKIVHAPQTKLTAFARETPTASASEYTAAQDHGHADNTTTQHVHSHNPTQIPNKPNSLGIPLVDAIELLRQQLKTTGQTTRFARLVVLLGHGASTINNPHEAAYECGACRGGKGAANARLCAILANHPDVRAGLKHEGIDIPEDTMFVGGMHDTTNDQVHLFDLHLVPDSHRGILQQTQQALVAAGMMNAHERCRRFVSVPLSKTPQQAYQHVQNRSYNLAEPRQEYGHCTNSLCIMGRRWLSRGLFLDRRAFLVSYDPTQDPDGSILERLILNVTPVGGGINLEYYFSRVDQNRYGCGTKLPHNITGLIGVMNGSESDLRTGLPYQMIEIHEPMRLLYIIESTTDRLLGIAKRNPSLERLLLQQWVQLIAMNPETGQFFMYTPQGFVPHLPTQTLRTVDSSYAYYRGHREHLSPVRIAGYSRS